MRCVVVLGAGRAGAARPQHGHSARPGSAHRWAAATAPTNPYNCADTPNPLPPPNTVWIEEMTWMDVRDALKAGKTTAIISTGGMEPNGPWLVHGKHNYVLRTNCDVIARKLGNALCAPIVELVPEGRIEPPSGHMISPGTISLREETFQAMLTDIAHSLKQHGFKNIIFIGDSGGNQNGQKAVADKLTAQWSGQPRSRPRFPSTTPRRRARRNVLRAAGRHQRRHAGRRPARQPGHHAQHDADRSEVGALGRAREGRQGDDQRRVDRRQGQGARMGEEDRRRARERTAELIKQEIAARGRN